MPDPSSRVDMSAKAGKAFNSLNVEMFLDKILYPHGCDLFLALLGFLNFAPTFIWQRAHIVQSIALNEEVEGQGSLDPEISAMITV